MSKQNRHQNHVIPGNQPGSHIPYFIVHNSYLITIFFLLSWAWASWWMGDVLRIAYERSFFATDVTLMHGLWQQSFGWLWFVGRALLTLYRWPLLGGLLVAVLLAAGAGLLGYCLRLSWRWRWVQFLPAAAWMFWTAHEGISLYYMHDAGRILIAPLLIAVISGLWAVVAKLTRRPAPAPGNSASGKVEWGGRRFPFALLFYSLFLLLLFIAPSLYLTHRHPYLRPLTLMEVQLLHHDYEGMSRTAHAHAELSYRQIAGFYAIALARTGHLADQLFDIKFDFEDIKGKSYFGTPNRCLDYHVVDCNYHAGLVRSALHYAILNLTSDGPSLHTLKYLIKIALIEGDWELARKYLRILGKAPFEGDFVRKYQPMVGHSELMKADAELSAVISSMPPVHVLENMYPKPCFLGYYAGQRFLGSKESQTWGAVACLYSKRMNDFLRFAQQYAGTMPPRSIAEGLVTQVSKYPELLKMFPQLNMEVNRYSLFLQEAEAYMQDPESGSQALFQKYQGYYPYYYFFGNLPSKEQQEEQIQQEFNAGVN